MPSPKSSRSGQIESHRRGRSSSFHGQGVMSVSQLRRPKTVSDLPSIRSLAGTATATLPEGLPRHPSKMLLKVTMLRSLAPVQMLMTPESTVRDLIAAAVRQYVKEGRRPILPAIEASDFDLHYSQFSLESLDRKEKLLELGSRNFFLCPRKAATTVEGSVTTSFASCAKEAKKERQGCGGGGGGFAWFKLMQFMM
ncbi:hypothetical protein AAZX31_13G300800 [Glycine max]|uniref:DUF7054 domain-containing protein n=2 Tax=Glycine subgen. Soja TaxID=1462606 RepID=C6TCK3_SOYBN|nr:uncharacterized protein LOC100786612 [Glycine max]XP_028191289.1 uncharacterized protein At4g22758-like [Glycine soja]XP_028191290.1 uncharacterized protein At4g22758-like [Glycine soja]XP_040863726.1 uncharacterized protein LOC100786612 isoform X1 [Glycine max]ACU19555.1 unknown [Glycine max]KAG4961195.1 hypothetical protein JHK87_037828 [Glycine soja]KAG4972213.1 hypothetical protein JHK85_038634 [Glycine max]KAG5131895.1 hypothetical protein JHK84_038292 [Glycine max]KAH1104381.1 hypo|eukprot:NP_001241218.1 uncharacterized protein LOC100786612 [Glycine max]